MLNTIPENMIEKAVSELKETNVLKYIWGGAMRKKNKELSGV